MRQRPEVIPARMNSFRRGTKQNKEQNQKTPRVSGVFFVIIMVMKITGPEGSTYLVNNKHGFGYSPEFKDWLKKHPHAMARVTGIIERIVSTSPVETLAEE